MPGQSSASRRWRKTLEFKELVETYRDFYVPQFKIMVKDMQYNRIVSFIVTNTGPVEPEKPDEERQK